MTNGKAGSDVAATLLLVAAVSAEFILEVPGVVVAGEARGATFHLTYQGRSIELMIPSAGYWFPPDEVDKEDNRRWLELVGDGRNALGAPAAGDKEDQYARAVSVYAVTIRLSSDIDVPYPFDRENKSAIRSAHMALDEMLNVAGAALDDWIRWAGVLRWQPQISLAQGERRRSWLRYSLAYTGTGERIPVGPSIGTTVYPLSDDTPLTLADLAAIEARITSGEERDLAAELLAESGRLQREGELRQAVLWAAVATEVKVREKLRAAAGADVGRLLAVMFDSPRDHSIAAVALFDKVADAVIGRSLRVENRTLYNKVITLFEFRNQVAHKGYSPSPHEARDAVTAARGASDWLESTAVTAHG